MTSNPPLRRLVVVGHGAAGLAAALAAAEEARKHTMAFEIVVMEKAAEEQAGGNTRWSPSNMRLAATGRLDPAFESDLLTSTGGRGDPLYWRALADNATAT